MPEPYYSDDAVTIYHGEALAVLQSLPSASVDGVIVDPPYSSGGAFRADRSQKTSSKYRGEYSPGAEGYKCLSQYPEFGGDNRDQRSYGYWCALWLSECLRISRPGAPLLMFSDWRQIPVSSDAFQAGGWIWRGLVVWDKGVGRPMKGRPRNHVEYVLWGSNGPMIPDDNPVYLNSVYRVAPPRPDGRYHLAQKPDDLLSELAQFVKPNGVILDPFMGSGTTLVAAKRTGRTSIGIEAEVAYCDIAARRIVAEPEQLDLEAA